MKLNPLGRHIHNQMIWPLMLAIAIVGVIATIIAVNMLGRVTERWLDGAASGAAATTRALVGSVHDDLLRSLDLLTADETLNDALIAGDAAAIETELRAANDRLGCDYLAVLDDTGAVVAAVGPAAPARGSLPLGPAFAGWAGDSSGFPEFGLTEDGLTLDVLEPVPTPGKQSWAFAASVRVDDRLLQGLEADASTASLVLTSSGEILAASFGDTAADEELADAATSPDGDVVPAFLALVHDPEAERWLTVDGHEYRLDVAEFSLENHRSSGDVFLGTIVDADVAVQTTATTTRLIAIWSIVGVLVLFALNWWIARSVSEPVAQLSRSAALVAEGDFGAKVEVSGSNEVAELAANFNRMTASLRDRSDALTKKVLELATLYEMSRSLGSTLELDILLESVLDSALRIFDVEVGYITMVDRETGALQLRALKGVVHARTSDGVVRSSMSEWVVREGRPLIYNPQAGGADQPGRGDDVTGALAALCVPLPSPEGTIGAITVGTRDPEQRFTSDDVRLLATIANHVTIAVGNIALFSSVQEAYLATVRALAAAVDAKDPYTRGHSDGVAAYALRIGEAMNLSSEQMVALEMAAYLHDIGKIGISEDILLKPGKLTDAEMSQMRHHPLIGANILKPVAFPWPIAPIVRHHHEHFDGGGYPAGLRTEEIPVLARVLTVADSFEAMVADRPYRRGRSQQEAILELRRCAGSQFDPRVVDAFIAVLESSDASAAGATVTDDDEIGPDEAQAVYIAICDGMFAGFRRLGGPRLANNLEKTVNEGLVAEGIPVVLQAGRLSPLEDEAVGESFTRYLARALELMVADMERASGSGLADHFLAEALQALPERMRGHAARLGFASSS